MVAKRSGQRTEVVTPDGMHVRFAVASASNIGALWQEIEDRVGCNGLACSWLWTESWLRHYGTLIPHRFVIGERDNAIAIALVTEGAGKKIGPFNIRTLHLGTSGEPDTETVRVQYNRVLAPANDRDTFVRGIIELARVTDARWDQFHLDGFSLEDLPRGIEDEPSFESLRDVCCITDLAAIRADGKTVLAALDSHAAKRIRRSIRYVEEDHGPIRVEWAESLDHAQDIFDEMVRLHEARWAAEGRQGVFSSPRFAGFHREIVEKAFPHGGVLLARVKAGDLTLGCDYSLIERNRVLAYQWGIAQLENKRASPGLVVGATVMQEALRRGIDEYDWLAGDAYYKRQLTTTSKELVWIRTSQGARIQAIYKLVEARNLAQRIPVLARKQATDDSPQSGEPIGLVRKYLNILVPQRDDIQSIRAK